MGHDTARAFEQTESGSESFIAQGAAGKVVRVHLEDGERGQTFAAKVVRVDSDDERNCVEDASDHKRCSAGFIECLTSVLLDGMYRRGESLHFPRIYGIAAEEEQPTEPTPVGMWRKLGSFLSPSYSNSSTTRKVKSVAILMEECDGSMLDFDKIIAKLQHGVPGKRYNREVYIHNAVFQVAMALAVAQDSYVFMHKDLHLGNVLISITRDQTYFVRGENGDIEERKLCEMTHFEYDIQGQKFRLPHIGFVVKLSDFGLSQVSVRNGGSSDGPLRLDDVNVVTFANSSDSALIQITLRSMANRLNDQFASRYTNARLVREGITFRKSFDLHLFMNHLATHPSTARNSTVKAFQHLELLGHQRKFGEITDFDDFRIDKLTFGTVTMRVPSCLDKCVTDPKAFVTCSEFAQYHACYEARDECCQRDKPIIEGTITAIGILGVVLKTLGCRLDYTQLQGGNSVIDAEQAEAAQEAARRLKLKDLNCHIDTMEYYAEDANPPDDDEGIIWPYWNAMNNGVRKSLADLRRIMDSRIQAVASTLTSEPLPALSPVPHRTQLGHFQEESEMEIAMRISSPLPFTSPSNAL